MKVWSSKTAEPEETVQRGAIGAAIGAVIGAIAGGEKAPLIRAVIGAGGGSRHRHPSRR